LSPTPVEYWIMTTYARERIYRAWWLERNQGLTRIEAYRRLADAFPQGLADLDPLPEEITGDVVKGAKTV